MRLSSVIAWGLLAVTSSACTSVRPTPPLAHGAVSAPEQLATEIGTTVLRNGGNAVDAAVAVGFALAVTHPTAENAAPEDAATEDAPASRAPPGRRARAAAHP